MKIFFIGDIVGRPGRQVLSERLPGFLQGEAIDFCIANGENAAGGSGLTVEVMKELLRLPIDVLTSGDHIWCKKEIVPAADTEERLLRPANLSPEAAGRGAGLYQARNGIAVGVINLQGRTFMKPCDCPFHTARRLVEELRKKTRVIIVDMHAEATSEKAAIAWFLDGQVSAVLGTHTHVQTADERILPGGTAFITDVGMTGPHKSIIGRRIDRVLQAALTQMPVPFDVAKEDRRISGAVVTVREDTGGATDIKRVQLCSETPN
jgi:hypothetical protein